MRPLCCLRLPSFSLNLPFVYNPPSSIADGVALFSSPRDCSNGCFITVVVRSFPLVAPRHGNAFPSPACSRSRETTTRGPFRTYIPCPSFLPTPWYLLNFRCGASADNRPRGFLSLQAQHARDYRARLPSRSQHQRLYIRDSNGTANAAALSYPEYNISVPIDHFHNDSIYEPHSNGTFNMRYWFDAQFYKPGGPVIALMSGETDGEDRWPFLQKGIVYQLAKATNVRYFSCF